MRPDTRKRKHAMAGLRAISGQERMLGTVVRVISSGKQALGAVMLERGRRVAESVLLIEREEIAGPDYYPTDPDLQKWAHEEGSLYLADQKVKMKRPRLRHVEQGEVPLQSMPACAPPGRSLRNYWRRFSTACRPRSMLRQSSRRPRPLACRPPRSRASSWI